MPTVGVSEFSPPGFLEDLDPAQRRAWSAWISGALDAARDGRPDLYDFDGPRAQFFNASKVPYESDKATLDITWTAFPRNVEVENPVARRRWRIADSSRDVQDEYCEWSVTRNTDNKITRVTFTCEGPEYWEFLASVNPDAVLRQYQEFVSPDVQREDLFDAEGVYQPRNRWNTSTIDGAMHLVQINNTLGAEIELAGGSSVVRQRNGVPLTDAQELIACGRYGDALRHSDPTIGERVNALTRQKADVTLEDPVGIYFHDLLVTNWTAPDGADPKSYWRYVRGKSGKFVRAVYEVPPGGGYVVGDVQIDGRNIEFGAQIADCITMKLTGVVMKVGQSTVSPMTGCKRRRTVFGGLEALAGSVVDQALRRGAATTRASGVVARERPVLGVAVESLSERESERRTLAECCATAWERYAVRDKNPPELALAKIHYEVASDWADAVLDGEKPANLFMRQGVSNLQELLKVVETQNNGDRENLIYGFFLILIGGGLDGLPTAKCIRDKLPRDRKPTEEEVRLAFKECSGNP